MNQPSLWTLLRKGADPFNASTHLETVESARKKLNALFWALVSVVVLTTAGLLACLLGVPREYGAELTTGVICLELVGAFAVRVRHTYADLKPLNAEIDSRCERALALVARHPEAAAYREEVLNTGREFVMFDLTRLEALANDAKSKDIREKAKVAFAAPDAESVENAYRKAVENNSKLACALVAVAVPCIALSLYLELNPFRTTLLAETIVFLMAILGVIVFRGDAVDLKRPMWLEHADLIEKGLALASSRGPGGAALAKLRSEGRSVTRGDVLGGLRLDRTERFACKALHKVSDAS